MKKVTKALLVGVTLTSTITAGITSSNSVTHKNRNIELTKELKESFESYDKLHTENKKLSKRVISEINRIMTLSDSVKHLDESLKKNNLALTDKIILSKDLSSKNKKITSRNKNLNNKVSENDDLNSKYNKLNSEISKAKQEILDVKNSITSSIFISNIETTPMKKKIRGNFVKTGNHKKIDGFKTKFQIINNNISNSSKTVSLKLSNSENKTLNYTNEIELDFNKKIIDVVAFIEVERKQITSGKYDLIVFVNNKKIKTSNIEIAIK